MLFLQMAEVKAEPLMAPGGQQQQQLGGRSKHTPVAVAQRLLAVGAVRSDPATVQAMLSMRSL
jgi:hypothetical protein